MGNNRKKRGRASAKPGNIMMGIASVLFCLVLFSTHLMGGLYARYTTSAEGSDSARVAKFGALILRETGDFDGTALKKGMIIPGVNLKKDVDVSFEGSEMATYVFVEVNVSSHWQMSGNLFFSGTQMQWAVADGWTLLTAKGNQYVYYRALEPNEILDQVDFIKDNGIIKVGTDITEADIGKLQGMTISLQASVIQSGGFASPQKAWDALANK